MTDCKSVVSLPDSFCRLSNLKKLSLCDCNKLGSLPERFGELKALASLDLYNCPAGKSMPAALKTQLEAQGCARGGTYGGGW